MVCQHCQQREAIVHLVITENSQTREVYLCEVCAKKNQEIGFVFQFNPAIMPEFLKASFGNNASVLEQPAEITCSKCGTPYSQIAKVGKLGCSTCYEVFEPQLEPLLRRLHGGGQNVGKVPARRGAALKTNRELDKLKEKLQQLVQQEVFEEAAVVRDQIRELEQKKGEEKYGA